MTWFDWWRGYSEADLVSALRKHYGHGPHKPGHVTPISMREIRALTRSLALLQSAPATSSLQDFGSKTSATRKKS